MESTFQKVFESGKCIVKWLQKKGIAQKEKSQMKTGVSKKIAPKTFFYEKQ